MTTIKAIETLYNGVLYRSRLEALWAAKMDELGIEHVYEPQGYKMGRVRYLPDFYLPDLDMFAEVKGVPDAKAAMKIERLMDETGKDVVLLLGNGRMQFFSAKFGGYQINDNFGKGSCEYNSYSFNSLIDHDEGRYKPKEKQEPAINHFEKAPHEDLSEPKQPELKQSKEYDEPTPTNAIELLKNESSLSRIWVSAISSVKQKKQAYGVLFMSTRVRFDSDSQMLKVIFPRESTFAYRAVQRQEIIEALAEALNSATGAKVPFEYEQATE